MYLLHYGIFCKHSKNVGYLYLLWRFWDKKQEKNVKLLNINEKYAWKCNKQPNIQVMWSTVFLFTSSVYIFHNGIFQPKFTVHSQNIWWMLITTSHSVQILYNRSIVMTDIRCLSHTLQVYVMHVDQSMHVQHGVQCVEFVI